MAIDYKVFTTIFDKVAVGTVDEARKPESLKAAFAEFIATFLFVYIGLGSAIANSKINPGDLTPAGLVAIALAHGFAIVITVAATAKISGGHVNPAVTFGLAVGGHITVLRLALYWVAQLLGASFASLLLKWTLATASPGGVPIHALGAGVTHAGGVILEIILTFSLVFVVYATAVDPKKGSIGIIAPLAIGFTVLADIFVGGPFTGASMNPARSFGPAFATFNFHNHWVYWVGPLVGGGIAGLLYDLVFLTPENETEDGGEYVPV
ncbi:hypothetical protein R1sor_021272 [Riccia sorocarpa]|uniref:Tonoplast intrinsic protein n=1 Tax=Riccia sorocarpa TaxID=122646 RepID=A0ABD3GI87_9MARC